MTEQMKKFARHSATAETIRSLEDGPVNPLTTKAWSTGRKALVTARRTLPVNRFAGQVLEMYHKANVFVLSSETGSGKSTQVPQMLAFDEYGSGKQIICTQPRRIAATSLASRVAQEMDVELGEEVGYAIGGRRKMTAVPDSGDGMFTRVAFMTEGSLVNAMIKSKTLSKVCCVIIDEAHERTCDTDVLLALLKRLLEDRPNGDFKVIIMSATLDAGVFQRYFNDCPLLTFPGERFPIDVQYIIPGEELVNVFTQAANVAVGIHNTKSGQGDILIFGPGVPELNMMRRIIEAAKTNMEIHTLHGGQMGSVQRQIIQGRSAKRKCILATPVAETSLTIDGVTYVIDTGLCKEQLYNPRLAMYDLVLRPISQASANQRMGRAGRTSAGVCYRLYTRAAYEDMPPSNTPRVLMSPLHDVVLKVASLGFPRCMDFDWITPPSTETLMRAAQDLENWSLIDSDGKRTQNGRAASRMPMEAMWYSCLDEADKLGCLSEMIDLAALSTIQDDIFERPDGFEIVADEAHRMWQAEGSDHLALLNAFWAYLQAREKCLSKPETLSKAENLAEWCGYRFLSFHSLEDALDKRHLLAWYIKRKGIFSQPYLPNLTMAERPLILQALTRGLCTNLAICRRVDGTLYHTVGANVQAQPAAHSATAGDSTEWVVYSKLTRAGGRVIIHHVSPVCPDWLLDLPILSDERLDKDFAGKAFRQPYVKQSLDRIRAEQQ
ncbi:hypothetical protein PWT90_00485 [Aphanocladium album]|nr:hypothetical protein PWT90_00485 [Aphanocladium album]